MADSAIACWDSKYFYNVWRPVTAMRTFISKNHMQINNWTPLGAPNSNTLHNNFTPPFPSYPSGHSTFGGCVFEILKLFQNSDDISLTIISDEFNGVTTTNGIVTQFLPRSYTSLNQLKSENGMSRLYLGVHFSFDNTEGIQQGEKIANYIINNCYQPLCVT